MRFVGLDLGTKTLGVSISDKTNTIVTPLDVIKFKFEDYDDALKQLKELLKRYDVSKIILGFPKNMDGSLGFASNRSILFKELLESSNYEVILYDERLSTKEAEGIIHGNEEDIRGAKDRIDSIAASLILESYIKGLK